MTDYMQAPLKELVKDIVADGVVDAAEVKGMRARLYADGVIDREEADFLFAVNDAVSGHKNNPGWKKCGGKSTRTKNIRSATPRGFAQAVFEANHS